MVSSAAHSHRLAVLLCLLRSFVGARSKLAETAWRAAEPSWDLAPDSKPPSVRSAVPRYHYHHSSTIANMAAAGAGSSRFQAFMQHPAGPKTGE